MLKPMHDAHVFFCDERKQVEKVLDAKWFKMEKERWPDGFDPATFADNKEEEDGMDEDVVSYTEVYLGELDTVGFFTEGKNRGFRDFGGGGCPGSGEIVTT